MTHKVLGEWFDTLLYVLLITVLVVFFYLYWGNEYSLCHAKVVLQDFLDETAISGRISEDEYAGLNKRLEDIYPGFGLELYCYQYSQQQIFDLISKDKWKEDFSKRNIISKEVLTAYEPQIYEKDETQLRMQTESNASVLAAEKGDYLPLPQDKTEFSVSAVRPFQEVYEGESLITLCRITDSAGMYYKEAKYTEGQRTGETLLELMIKDTLYLVPVDVICYPRNVLCEKGHRVVNTKAILEEKKANGNFICPYCCVIPEQILCDETEVYIKTGKGLEDIRLTALVTYLNGKTETITSESEEWQDDFDQNYCGMQEVSIRYRNVETKIMVVSENPLCETCGETCNDRCYEDYIKYPFCAECLSGMYLDTGEKKEEEVLLTQKDMQHELDMKGEILLNRGDFFTIVCTKGKDIIMLQRDIKINGKSGKKK